MNAYFGDKWMSEKANTRLAMQAHQALETKAISWVEHYRIVTNLTRIRQGYVPLQFTANRESVVLERLLNDFAGDYAYSESVDLPANRWQLANMIKDALRKWEESRKTI